MALLAYGFTRDARYIHSPLVARPAPSFGLALFDGKMVNLEDFRGNVVLLNSGPPGAALAAPRRKLSKPLGSATRMEVWCLWE